MSTQPNYTAQLEVLILDVLLPVYEQHCRQRGISMLRTEVNPELLKQLQKKKTVARLFLPKPKHDNQE
jgi:hypothetical protein